MGPLGRCTVLACPSPNAYTLALPRRMRCSLTVNVDRLKPFFERVGAPAATGPVSDPGQEGENEVELLINRRRVRRVTRYLHQYLVRRRGHTSGTHRLAARRRAAAAVAAAAATSCRPAAGGCFGRLPADSSRSPAEVATGPALLGRTVLCCWPGPPGDGWVRGTVVRRSRTQGFSHVIRYGPRSALGAAIMVDSLLSRCRLARAGWPLGPAVPDARAGPLL